MRLFLALALGLPIVAMAEPGFFMEPPVRKASYPLDLKFHRAMYKNDLKQVAIILEQFKKKFPYAYGEYQIYKEALNFKPKKPAPIKHKILVMIHKGSQFKASKTVSVGTKNSKGTYDFVKETRDSSVDYISPNHKVIITDIKPHLEIMRKYILYIHKGLLDLEFTFVESPAILGEVKKSKKTLLAPVWTSLNPKPQALLDQYLETHDSIISIYPIKKVSGGLQLNSMSLTPLKAKGKRKSLAMINILYFQGWMKPIQLIHEFFHVIEWYHRNKPGPIHVVGNKKLWPKWFHGGGQLLYYKKALENQFTKVRNMVKRNR